ncbi:MAG: RlmE family RNA methyltransferase [Deltaproteobacteria bacterium]|nr:RlmE family RNA methyltransferase [Deltaproteobacteria bacterium]
MAYDRKDRFYRKAKEKGFKSRAAFKLIEINKKFNLMRPGMQVIDLGCAPGGWLQVIAQEIGPSGKVVGVDLEPIHGIVERNLCLIQGDINQQPIQRRISAELGRRVDLVVSDMAPNLSGVKFQDHYNSYLLAQMALHCCSLFLRERGGFVVKIFPGEELENYKKALKERFAKVQTFLPEATRKTSIDMYLISSGFIPPKTETPTAISAVGAS